MTINLLQKFSKLAGYVCGVEIQDRSMASTDIITVIKDDSLLCKRQVWYMEQTFF